jgi:hypothetical protein
VALESSLGASQVARLCFCVPGGFRRLCVSCFRCAFLPAVSSCVLTEKHGNFGFIFGIKTLISLDLFWLQVGIFSEKPPKPARRASSPARSGRLVSGQAGKAEGRRGARYTLSRRYEKKSELFA